MLYTYFKYPFLRSDHCQIIQKLNCLKIDDLFMRSGPEVIKLFSYSAEHDIDPAHKCYNANNSWHFNIY